MKEGDKKNRKSGKQMKVEYQVKAQNNRKSTTNLESSISRV
jgi:hypothetical protein